VDELPYRRFMLAEHGCDFAVVVVEHLPQKEGGTLFRAEALRYVQEGDRDIAGPLSRGFRGVLFQFDKRLRQPLPDVGLTLGFGSSQPVDCQARDHRHQPGLGRLEPGMIGGAPAQPGILQHILGIGAYPQHAIDDAEKAHR
jgi:hypothetical protein